MARFRDSRITFLKTYPGEPAPHYDPDGNFITSTPRLIALQMTSPERYWPVANRRSRRAA